MKIGTKFSVAGIVALALIVGGGAAARAGTTLYWFNVVAPYFGGAAYAPSQTKAIASYPGLLNQVTVGGGYTLSAKECVNLTVSCGTTVSATHGANLPNNISAGTTKVTAQMWVPTFNLVDVSVTGYFASN